MTLKKRIATLLLSFLLLFVIGGESFLSAFGITASAETILSYDDYPIESDMANMEESKYPKNENGECEVVGFMEYCYSKNPSYKSVYGLYIYVYNPTEIPLIVNEGENTVTMASQFDQAGSQSYVKKYKLTYLDNTDNYRFYKFKLSSEDSTSLYKVVHAYENTWGIRRYEISELNILFKGNSRAKSFGISKIYDFSGYAAWCGDPQIAVSTLKCECTGKQDVPLQVYDTNYRFAEKDDYLRDDLQSVYFSVPNVYMDKWGDLSAITAEWYQYRTKPCFVTSDPDAYSALFGVRGKYINEYGQLIDSDGNVLNDKIQTNWRVLWEEMSLSAGDPGAVFKYYYFSSAFNPNVDDYLGSTYILEDDYTLVDSINWIFYREDAVSQNDYAVSSSEMKEYVVDYTRRFYTEELLHNRYHPELFDLNSPLSLGYQTNTFNVTDSFEYLDASKNQSAWSKFWFGTDIESFSYSPIVTISEGDFYLEAEAFSEKYLVEQDDVESIIEFAKEALSKDETPLLLRFAKSDYYASTARFDEASEDNGMSSQDGYVAVETVFLDFDILSLTFNKDGAVTVIGVVADSIDIINGLTAPEDISIEEEEWWQKIMAILLIIVLINILSFFFPVIKIVLNAVWSGIKTLLGVVLKVLFLPFRLIGLLFKRN